MSGWLAVCLGLSGCAYTVQLTSVPPAAEVHLPRGDQVVRTPADVRLRWVPFGRQEITVTAPGYRSVTLDLRKTEIRGSRFLRDALFRPATFGGQPRGRVSVVLVPAHGPTGTWTEDQVP